VLIASDEQQAISGPQKVSVMTRPNRHCKVSMAANLETTRFRLPAGAPTGILGSLEEPFHAS
jgi:hypothetical protein